ncbi:inositol monophosphatase family protein [Brevibacillus sp. B_LB10_24]|uniref:inositol monophosphatase family protein n=1 Tax=Brevibacillus sp. B_LB10_24 TaxID=3380645 RepID=UPI0038B8B018
MTQFKREVFQELFSQVGDRLLQDYGHREAPLDRQEMFARFLAANAWAADEVKAVLQREYPEVQRFYSDLDADRQDPQPLGTCWVLDLIDGGFHLQQGFAFWSMSLCLVEDGTPVFSLVYDPNRREFFHAIRGKGAYLNGKAIHVAGKSDLHNALLMTAPPSFAEEEPLLTKSTIDGIGKLLPRVFAIRMLGSVALQLAYVASGRMDGYWEFGEDNYDRLGGALLISEAGGRVTDISGREFALGSSGIIASNASLSGQIRKVLQS